MVNKAGVTGNDGGAKTGEGAEWSDGGGKAHVAEWRRGGAKRVLGDMGRGGGSVPRASARGGRH